MTATPTPEVLHRFVCGALPDHEAERVAEWIDRDPNAEVVLRAIRPQDTILGLLDTVPRTPPAPDHMVDQLVHTFCRSLPVTVAGDQKVSSPVPILPQQVGQYKIVRELGKGGMGVVYEAVHATLGRKVALKMMLCDALGDSVARQRFVRECQTAATVDSEHVVRIYDAGEVDGLLFLAMEYLPGENLEAWLNAKRGPATVGEALGIARQMLTGLVALHECGLIHRDIKPQNVMLEARDGEPLRVKLLDLGLARGVGEADAITRPNAVIGTPEYMAPEQANAQALDAKCDVFSVGVVLHRAFGGVSPFRRKGMMPTLEAVAKSDPPPLEGVPPEVDAFVRQLLAKNPGQRPTAKDALARVAELEESLATVSERAANRSPRSRLRVLAACLAGAIALAAVIVIVFRDKNGKELGRFEVPEGTQTIEVVVPEKKQKEKEPTVAAVPPEVRIGSRVRVTAQTQGFANREGSPSKSLDFVPAGTKGQLLFIAEEPQLGLVRIEWPEGRFIEVWVALKRLAVE